MSWTLIEHQALTSSVASVTLGSGGTIPQTYKTLKLVMSARLDTNGGAVWYDVIVKPNNATANQTSRVLYGNGSTATSYSGTSFQTQQASNTATTSTFGSAEITFPNYASTTANKPMSQDTVTENNATSAFQGMHAFLWSDTTAITSIVCAALTGNLVSGSTFTLYGLA